MTLPVLITGCARSGTGYGAAVFEACGFRCEHETLFSPYTTAFEGFGSVEVESSWLAVPFIPELPSGTVVVHHVRRPEAVVQSLLGIGFFEPQTTTRNDTATLLQVLRSRGLARSARRALSPERWRRGRRLRSDFVAFLREHEPAVFLPEDPAERAWQYWFDWNRRTEREVEQAGLEYLRHRVEDGPTKELVDLVHRLRPAADRTAIEKAVRRVPRDTNTRRHRAVSSVPGPEDPELRRAVVSLASRYGYELKGS